MCCLMIPSPLPSTAGSDCWHHGASIAKKTGISRVQTGAASLQRVVFLCWWCLAPGEPSLHNCVCLLYRGGCMERRRVPAARSDPAEPFAHAVSGSSLCLCTWGCVQTGCSGMKVLVQVSQLLAGGLGELGGPGGLGASRLPPSVAMKTALCSVFVGGFY